MDWYQVRVRYVAKEIYNLLLQNLVTAHSHSARKIPVGNGRRLSAQSAQSQAEQRPAWDEVPKLSSWSVQAASPVGSRVTL